MGLLKVLTYIKEIMHRKHLGTAWHEVTLRIVAVLRGSWVSWEASGAGMTRQAFKSGRLEFKFQLWQLIAGMNWGPSLLEHLLPLLCNGVVGLHMV